MRNICKVIALLYAFWGVAGTAAAENYSGLNVIAPSASFDDVSRTYSSMNATYVRYGKNMTVDQVRKVSLGQYKSDVTGVLGKPISANNDGSWYYEINLPYRTKNKFVCQYRVYFDDTDKVTATVWRRHQCADLVTGKLD